MPLLLVLVLMLLSRWWSLRTSGVLLLSCCWRRCREEV
jgi:hypothetical protein